MADKARIYPHVYKDWIGNPRGVIEELKLCVCGIDRYNEVHDPQTIMLYMQDQLEALKETTPSEPKIDPGIAEVTVIINGPTSTVIYNMEMRDFHIDEKFAGPKFVDFGRPIFPVDAMATMAFIGMPILQADGSIYKVLKQSK